jgi:hypothetical protein
MSIRSWGGFVLNESMPDTEKIEFSFQVNKLALENKIGIKLGWNVWPDFRKEYKNQNNVLPFEFIDSPLSDVAQILFSGDGVRLFEEHQRVDSGENLDSRMKRVQNFILEVFCSNVLKEMVLYVDSGFGEEQYLEVKARDFKNSILQFYTHGKTWEPTIKFIIKKD